MNETRSPTNADNRFDVVSPAERTKHHLTPYLTELISACAMCCHISQMMILVPLGGRKDEHTVARIRIQRRRRKEQLRKVLSVGLPFDDSRTDCWTHKFLCVYCFAAGDDWTQSTPIQTIMLFSAMGCRCLADDVFHEGRRKPKWYHSARIQCSLAQLVAPLCCCRLLAHSIQSKLLSNFVFGRRNDDTRLCVPFALEICSRCATRYWFQKRRRCETRISRMAWWLQSNNQIIGLCLNRQSTQDNILSHSQRSSRTYSMAAVASA